MPIHLHVDTAGPLDNRISSDGIRKWRHDNVDSIVLSRAQGGIEICHQIAGPFGTERVGYGCFKAEHGQRAYRRLHELRRGFAWRWCDRSYDLLGGRATERPDKAGDESIQFLRGDVNMGEVVLRPNSPIGTKLGEIRVFTGNRICVGEQRNARDQERGRGDWAPEHRWPSRFRGWSGCARAFQIPACAKRFIDSDQRSLGVSSAKTGDIPSAATACRPEQYRSSAAVHRYWPAVLLAHATFPTIISGAMLAPV